MADMQIPKSLIASYVFLAIAVVGYLPTIHLRNNPVDGFEGWGPGVGAVACFLFFTLPAACLSVICGLLALRKGLWALVAIVPSIAFLGYVVLQMTQSSSAS